MVVRGEHYAGAGVGVAGDPGAVDREHHQQHQHEHGDDGLDVWTQTLLRLLLLRHMLAHLAGLQGETNTIMTGCKVCSVSGRWIIECNKLLNELIEQSIFEHPQVFLHAAWWVNIILYKQQRIVRAVKSPGRKNSAQGEHFSLPAPPITCWLRLMMSRDRCRQEEIIWMLWGGKRRQRDIKLKSQTLIPKRGTVKWHFLISLIKFVPVLISVWRYTCTFFLSDPSCKGDLFLNGPSE